MLKIKISEKYNLAIERIKVISNNLGRELDDKDLLEILFISKIDPKTFHHNSRRRRRRS
jgi:hypothetical protein